MSKCLFCLIVKKELPAQIVHETDHVIVFADRSPRAPVHLLVVPKEHVVNINDLSDAQSALAVEMLRAVQYLAKRYGNAPDSGFNLISNNGKSAGQAVFHMHWHFLAGKNIYEKGISL